MGEAKFRYYTLNYDLESESINITSYMEGREVNPIIHITKKAISAYGISTIDKATELARRIQSNFALFSGVIR